MFKRLTLQQLVKLYSEGVVLKFKKKSHPDFIKGEYSPDCLEIYIYLSHIDSKYDRDITILHELIHARNDLFPKKSSKDTEYFVEKEAIETYHKKPEVIEFIKAKYELD